MIRLRHKLRRLRRVGKKELKEPKEFHKIKKEDLKRS